MKKINFKRGDDVELLNGWREDVAPGVLKHLKRGDRGKVCRVDGISGVGVDFGRDIDGHNCMGNCKYNYGQIFAPKHLKKVEKKSRRKVEKR